MFCLKYLVNFFLHFIKLVKLKILIFSSKKYLLNYNKYFLINFLHFIKKKKQFMSLKIIIFFTFYLL